VTTLFISDLHLGAVRPCVTDQFLRFLETEARNADALYILGDLFESWAGDDDPDEHYAWIRQALSRLTRKGIPVFFMPGNRDFMVGKDFAAETGVILLADPHLADIQGTRVLLSHGDAYCTDDIEYQAIREMTRDPQWQAMMLDKPLGERLAIAAKSRDESRARSGTLAEAITDVNAIAIDAALREAGVDVMLHGHTHRPAVHEFVVDGRPRQRIVLGDWYEQGSVVRWDTDGPLLAVLARQGSGGHAGVKAKLRVR